MDFWSGLLDVLILLLAALALGALFERLRLSAVVGYLLAGTLLGPNAFNLLPSHRAISSLAELGVILLLFTIGLEFSWGRLRRMGAVALGGGTVQVLATGALAALAARGVGLPWPTAMAVGAILALSSTAAVLRLLVSRAEIDSMHGRNALGILLLQDISVVPLALFVTALARGFGLPEIDGKGLANLGIGVACVVVAYLVLRYVVPVFLKTREASRNRELAILLAVTTAGGAAWGSHALGLSPALGAFVAGMLLAESPFAVQIRADIAALRVLFITLFFSSIGTYADPAWVARNGPAVAGGIAAVVVGKTLVTAGATLLFRTPPGVALAGGLCLAQVGEFSFVLAETAHSERLIGDDLLAFLVTVTIGTLFLTPYLVALAPRVSLALGKLAGRAGEEASPAPAHGGHVVVIGYGPAGRRVADDLGQDGVPLVVVELNSRSAAVARSLGYPAVVGDARSDEVLEHAHLATARAVVMTIPDPETARRVVERVHGWAPETPIVARARYHVRRFELQMAGAIEVVDEEEEVGARISARVRERIAAGGQNR